MTFSFPVEVFSREIAAEIRNLLLVTQPPGAVIADRSEQEEVHPEAHVADLYAPMHSYNYRVSGTISGSVTGVLHTWQRLRGRDFVDQTETIPT